MLPASSCVTAVVPCCLLDPISSALLAATRPGEARPSPGSLISPTALVREGAMAASALGWDNPSLPFLLTLAFVVVLLLLKLLRLLV